MNNVFNNIRAFHFFTNNTTFNKITTQSNTLANILLATITKHFMRRYIISNANIIIHCINAFHNVTGFEAFQQTTTPR